MNCKFWAQQTPRVAGQEGRVCSLTFLNHTNLKEEEKIYNPWWNSLFKLHVKRQQLRKQKQNS